MEYRWTFHEKSNEETTENIAKDLNISKTLAQVLVKRDISVKEDAEKFFSPSLKDLNDPFLMKNMDRAVERILQARDNEEGVWVHGDYDVDGTSATAIMVLFS